MRVWSVSVWCQLIASAKRGAIYDFCETFCETQEHARPRRASAGASGVCLLAFRILSRRKPKTGRTRFLLVEKTRSYLILSATGREYGIYVSLAPAASNVRHTLPVAFLFSACSSHSATQVTAVRGCEACTSGSARAVHAGGGASCGLWSCACCGPSSAARPIYGGTGG